MFKKTLFILLLSVVTLNAKLLILHVHVPQHPNPSTFKYVKELASLAKKHNLEVEFKGVPWKRGLILIEQGKADGLVGASYTKDRAKYGVYPMKDGKLDHSRRSDNGKTYFLYKNKNSSITWDGKKFSNVDGVIGAKRGYAIVNDLKKHKNIQFKELPNLNVSLRKLITGKLVAYAGLEMEIEDLENKSEFKKHMIKEPIPLRQKPYFVMFSKIRYENKKEEIEKFWDMLKK